MSVNLFEEFMILVSGPRLVSSAAAEVKDAAVSVLAFDAWAVHTAVSFSAFAAASVFQQPSHVQLSFFATPFEHSWASRFHGAVEENLALDCSDWRHQLIFQLVGVCSVHWCPAHFQSWCAVDHSWIWMTTPVMFCFANLPPGTGSWNTNQTRTSKSQRQVSFFLHTSQGSRPLLLLNGILQMTQFLQVTD